MFIKTNTLVRREKSKFTFKWRHLGGFFFLSSLNAEYKRLKTLNFPKWKDNRWSLHSGSYSFSEQCSTRQWPKPSWSRGKKHWLLGLTGICSTAETRRSCDLIVSCSQGGNYAKYSSLRATPTFPDVQWITIQLKITAILEISVLQWPWFHCWNYCRCLKREVVCL